MKNQKVKLFFKGGQEFNISEKEILDVLGKTDLQEAIDEEKQTDMPQSFKFHIHDRFHLRENRIICLYLNEVIGFELIDVV